MFAVGWPRVLASPAAGAGEAAVALEHDARADAVALVTRASVEVWNGGRHRTRAGGFARSPATVAEEGAHVAARWRDGGEVLAVAAEGGVVHLFDVAFFQDPPSAAPVPGATARRCRLVPEASLFAWAARRPRRRPLAGRALARARRGRGRGRRPRRRLARRRVRLPRRRRPRPPRRHVHGPRRAVRLGFRPRLSRRRRGGGVLVLDPGRRRPRPHGPPRERGRRPRRPRLRPRAPRRRRRRRVRRVRRVALLLRSSLGLRRRVFVGRPRGDPRADPRARPERRRTRPDVVDASKPARAPGVANATRARLAPDARRVAVGASRAARRFFLRVRRRVDAGSSRPRLLEPSRRVMTAGDLGARRGTSARSRTSRGRARVGVRRRVGARRVRRVDPVGCRVMCASRRPGVVATRTPPRATSSSERADSRSRIPASRGFCGSGDAAARRRSSSRRRRRREASAAPGTKRSRRRVEQAPRERSRGRSFGVAFAAPRRRVAARRRRRAAIRRFGVFVASDAAFAARLGSRSRSRARAGSGSGSRAAAAAATRLPSRVRRAGASAFAAPDARGASSPARASSACTTRGRAGRGVRRRDKERAFEPSPPRGWSPSRTRTRTRPGPRGRASPSRASSSTRRWAEEGDSFFTTRRKTAAAARGGSLVRERGWGFFDAWFGEEGRTGGARAPAATSETGRRTTRGGEPNRRRRAAFRSGCTPNRTSRRPRRSSRRRSRPRRPR